MNVLLLEDDIETVRALTAGLSREGYEVEATTTVPDALARLENQSFDIAVLDVMVPGGSGYDVVARLRSGKSRTRILMLTARGSVADRVEGLDRGADDFLVKPFAFDELAARIRALERRQEDSPDRLQWGSLEVDLIRRSAKLDDHPIDLTPTEYGLLVTLLLAGKDGMSRKELLREVWGYDFEPGTNIVDVHVNRLRRKLEVAGVPDMIQTLRGHGYAAR